MKLSEITKNEFLNTLKDPSVASIRRKIKELRKILSKNNWGVKSSFDPIQRQFRIDTYDLSDKLTYWPTAQLEQLEESRSIVYAAIRDLFDSSKYKINITRATINDITFWVSADVNFR